MITIDGIQSMGHWVTIVPKGHMEGMLGCHKLHELSRIHVIVQPVCNVV